MCYDFAVYGQNAAFLFVIRAALRIAPMMVADRSTFSHRAILFLLVLLAMPAPARSASLEDAAKELAEKIAAALPANQNVILSVEKDSTASRPMQFAALLAAELESRGLHVSSPGPAPVRIDVTFSANVTGDVWIAELHSSDFQKVVLVATPRTDERLRDAAKPPVALLSELIWEGPEQILDAATAVSANGDASLLLLAPDGLIVRDASGSPPLKIEVPARTSPTRFLQGRFLQLGDTIIVRIDTQTCRFNRTAKSLLGCEEKIEPVEPSPSFAPFGTASAFVTSGCSGAIHLLGTGGADFTQPDFVGILKWEGGAYTALGSRVYFAGPVLFLHAFPDAPVATAIVKNLQSGNYEAYRISISCAH